MLKQEILNIIIIIESIFSSEPYKKELKDISKGDYIGKPTLI